MNRNSRYDPEAASAAQDRYCAEHGVPRFAPRGVCWSCGESIFLPLARREETGITVAAAEAYLITSCPHCKRSYLD